MPDVSCKRHPRKDLQLLLGRWRPTSASHFYSALVNEQTELDQTHFSKGKAQVLVSGMFDNAFMTSYKVHRMSTKLAAEAFLYRIIINVYKQADSHGTNT